MTGATDLPEAAQPDSPGIVRSSDRLCVTRRREPTDIVAEALDRYKPVRVFAGLSGGNGSVPAVHWAMNNVPGCEVMHLNTGIGVERGRQWVRDLCKAQGWPLHEIRALEDCGQDYDALVRQYGFPGPDGHGLMYQRLKERCVWELMRRVKKGHPRSAKVLFITGIRYADSVVRTGYVGREVNKVRGQVWANPLYWWTDEENRAYRAATGIGPNPVAEELGMSGECGCGAFAHRGELKKWESVDPTFGIRIRRLEAECLARGMTWGWEGRPPKGGFNADQGTLDLPQMPLCTNCVKSAVVQAELADEVNS
jgi:3'-phosphoadenosine 5'-phosphosulfate sulfotransferase (PAPS reductase)/FAD synthetase